MENQNRRIFFYFYFFNPRILVLWETGTGEFSFCEKPELENFFFLSENSPIVENQNPRIFFFFYPRILVLWDIRIGEFFFFLMREFSFCGKR